MDLISVIIPYFKKKNFIETTIKSVLHQTYKYFELILIYDDVDHSELEFLKKLLNSDSRIKIIVNKKNLGAGESRNIGIENSLGRYIAFLDADDLWNEEKLELQLKFMKSNKFDITHCSYHIIDKKNEILGKRIARDFNNLSSLLKSCDIGLSSVMLKKEILNDECKFPKLKTKEDFVLWLTLLKNNYKIFGIDKILLKWRKSKGSLSSSIFQKLIDGFRVYKVYMKYNFIYSLYLLFCLCLNYLKKND